MKFCLWKDIVPLVILDWFDVEHAENRGKGYPHFRFCQPSSWANPETSRQFKKKQQMIVNLDRRPNPKIALGRGSLFPSGFER